MTCERAFGRPNVWLNIRHYELIHSFKLIDTREEENSKKVLLFRTTKTNSPKLAHLKGALNVKTRRHTHTNDKDHLYGIEGGRLV